MLLLCNGLAGCGGVGWAVFFGLRGDWPIVALEVLVVATSLISARLAQSGRLRAACHLLLALMYAVLVVFAGFIDLPTPVAHRSAHVLILAMGAVSSLLLRDEALWLRHGVPLLHVATFIFFGASEVAFSTAHALPEEVQAVGGWVNLTLASALIYLTLWVIQTDAAERSALEVELRLAIAGGDMLLQFQPQVDVDGRVSGAEALLRWRHKTRGLVPPGEFIPLAERSGLMGPLGDWVLEEGCRQLAVWAQDPRAADLVLAINISAVQIERPDFVEQVLVCVERAGVDPSKLKLELTESVLARDLNDVADKLRRLKERGIGCSLDDFGTGYSSLRYLQRLPLDQLKIDRSFVGNLLNTPSDAAIARTMIELGRSLNLQVIAEGVETDEQRRALLSMGCSRYQGFLFARPLDADQFLAFVHDAPASGVGTALVSKQAACGPCGPAIGPGLSVAATAEA